MLFLFISRPFVSLRYPRSGKHDDDDDGGGDDDYGSCTDAQSHRRVVSRRRDGKKKEKGAFQLLGWHTSYLITVSRNIYIYGFTFFIG